MGISRGGPVSAAGVAACLLLAGCTGTGEVGAVERPSASSAPPADWRNTTYSLTCDGVVPTRFRASLTNGTARVSAVAGQTANYDYYDIRFGTAADGDVDGDGVPDTVVLLYCSPQPSNGILEEVLVYSGADGRLIDDLPSATTLEEAVVLAPLYDPAGLKVKDGDIVAAMRVYGPGDSHASGPSEHTTVRWRWDGQRFERIQ
jgi:hypothetical protein